MQANGGSEKQNVRSRKLGRVREGNVWEDKLRKQVGKGGCWGAWKENVSGGEMPGAARRQGGDKKGHSRGGRWRGIEKQLPHPRVNPRGSERFYYPSPLLFPSPNIILFCSLTHDI